MKFFSFDKNMDFGLKVDYLYGNIGLEAGQCWPYWP